jgi:hypothetical protein
MKYFSWISPLVRVFPGIDLGNTRIQEYVSHFSKLVLLRSIECLLLTS